MKYTKEILASIVANSCSVAEVMRRLGFRKVSGGNHSHISRTIKRLGISTEHFTGQASNRGPHHVGGPDKLTATQVLCIDRRNGMKEAAFRLRRALSEVGRLPLCENCGVGIKWQSAPLVLEIHHINGDSLDNRLENLQYLCPN